MRYARSEHLGIVRSPDGQSYSLNFYGENEGAAVVAGPVPIWDGTGLVRLEPIPEVHREPAANASEARTKLDAWLVTNGWTGRRLG